MNQFLSNEQETANEFGLLNTKICLYKFDKDQRSKNTKFGLTKVPTCQITRSL